MNFIPQMEPWFDESEARALYDYIKSGGWVTEFRETRRFEEMIGDFTGARHCVATNNGTISLTIALLAAGVSPGNEVIVPDLTMVATPNSAKLIGAEPVFVDVEPETLCLDIDQTANAITHRTKAVIHVSFNGRSNDLGRLHQLCRARGIALIEDAAQSLGSYWGRKHLGTTGDIGSFSFSAPKIISTGQGGALLTDDDELALRIRKLKDFGRIEGGNDIHDSIGFNFKFTDVQALIGIEQMKKLPWRINRKKEIYSTYLSLLGDVDAITWVPTDLTVTAPWFVDIYVPDPEGLQAHLKEQNVGSRRLYPAIHSQKAYGLNHLSFPVTELASRKGLWLPSSTKLSDDDIARVCTAVRSYF